MIAFINKAIYLTSYRVDVFDGFGERNRFLGKVLGYGRDCLIGHGFLRCLFAFDSFLNHWKPSKVALLIPQTYNSTINVGILYTCGSCRLCKLIMNHSNNLKWQRLIRRKNEIKPRRHRTYVRRYLNRTDRIEVR